jgi:hypothetical protein
MTEAEFERRLAGAEGARSPSADGGAGGWSPPSTEPPEAEPPASASAMAAVAEAEPPARAQARASASSRSARPARPSARPRRVQRMFAVEEELDRKLWLYAIHVGKDRSDVVNDLLRPLVGSMVLYDSRERRTGRAVEPEPDA